MTKSERFGLVLSPDEKRALLRLAEGERISAAAVVRRLVWDAAKRLDSELRGVFLAMVPDHLNEHEEVQQ